MRRALVHLCLLLSGTPLAVSVGAQSLFHDVVGSAFEMAQHLENLRTLPEKIDVADQSLTPSEWMQLGILAVLNISGTVTAESPRATWRMPADLYPAVVLSSDVYTYTLDREAYLAFFNAIEDAYPDGATLPSMLPIRGGEIRFVDSVHLLASALRFYAAFDRLPAFLDPKVSTPRGLYRWGIPAGKELYYSAFQNQNSDPYLRTEEYYWTSSLEFELYDIARGVVSGIVDPYAAGEAVFDWSRARYDSSPYGINYDIQNLTGFSSDSWEVLRNMQGTSGKPSAINSGLYVAAGLVHGYDMRGYGGALFTEPLGWYNAEIHARYGDPLSENSHFLFAGDPQPQRTYVVPISPEASLFGAVSEVTALDGPTTSFRAFWVNPSDIFDYGAEDILQTASDGGFSHVVLTVKSFVGRLYFDTGSNDNLGGDALGMLTAARSAFPEVDILAALNTVTDYEHPNRDSWGQQYFSDVGGQSHNLFFMSPCVPAYVDYLRRLITALDERYDIDGLVLARNYVHSNAWANPECSMSAGTSDEVKEGRIAEFANALAAHAKSANVSWSVYYMTAPLMADNGGLLAQYSHDATPSRLSASYFDGIVLTLHGLAWLTDDNEDFDEVPVVQKRDQIVSDYDSWVGMPLYTMVHLSKDWMYGPGFYRGIARLYRSKGLSGVLYTGINSAEGEFGPAMVRQQLATLRHTRFDDPPPASEVVTGLAGEVPAGSALTIHTPFPNPAADRVAIVFDLPSVDRVRVEVFDLAGRRVDELFDALGRSGRQRLDWNLRDVASGVYIIRFTSSAGAAVARVVVLKTNARR